MAKLTERLRKSIEKGDVAIKTGRNLVDFLANKIDISEAIEEGWSRKMIHQQLQKEGKITMSYPNFCLYIKKYIVGKEDEGANTITTRGKEKEPGFDFKPSFKKEDLY